MLSFRGCVFSTYCAVSMTIKSPPPSVFVNGRATTITRPSSVSRGCRNWIVVPPVPVSWPHCPETCCRLFHVLQSTNLHARQGFGFGDVRGQQVIVHTADIAAAARLINETATATIDVGRSSLWLINSTTNSLELLFQVDEVGRDAVEARGQHAGDFAMYVRHAINIVDGNPYE